MSSVVHGEYHMQSFLIGSKLYAWPWCGLWNRQGRWNKHHSEMPFRMVWKISCISMQMLTFLGLSGLLLLTVHPEMLTLSGLKKRISEGWFTGASFLPQISAQEAQCSVGSLPPFLTIAHWRGCHLETRILWSISNKPHHGVTEKSCTARHNCEASSNFRQHQTTSVTLVLIPLQISQILTPVFSQIQH